MIRLALLTLFVSGLAVYAWRDWYRSLCGLILLMAVVEHPDMPKNMLGVQGLNPWNLLLLVVALAWLATRSRERSTWDLPRSTTVLLLLYLGILMLSTLRLFADPSGLVGESTGYMVGEYLLNTFKWVVPGLLLFIGCRTRERFVWGMTATLGVYFLLGLLVIKWMPPSAGLSGSELAARSLKVLEREVGYHRVNLSMMLAGASWAILATQPILKRGIMAILGFLLIAYAQALTGGRGGYITWGIVGIALCVVKWRKRLLLVPLAAIAIVLFLPGVVDRMTQGFTNDSRDSNALIDSAQGTSSGLEPGIDDYTVTAGRTFAWPFVISKIQESPVLGFGRQAMIRTGLSDSLWTSYGESFPHPHNAYLEILIDSGLIGFVLVVPFYLAVLYSSISLFRDARAPEMAVAGGVTAALVLALLVASMGSQTFYPREGAVGMWCAIGLMWRVRRQRAAVADETSPGTFDLWKAGADEATASERITPMSSFPNNQLRGQNAPRPTEPGPKPGRRSS